jgi:hypothetical protein
MLKSEYQILSKTLLSLFSGFSREIHPDKPSKPTGFDQIADEENSRRKEVQKSLRARAEGPLVNNSF